MDIHKSAFQKRVDTYVACIKTIMFHFEKMTRETKKSISFQNFRYHHNNKSIRFAFVISYKMKNLIILLCGKNVIIKTINLVVSYLR